MSAEGRQSIGWPAGVHGTTLIVWLALRDSTTLATSALNGHRRDDPHFTTSELAFVAGIGGQAVGNALRDLAARDLVACRIRTTTRAKEYALR